MDIGHIGSKDQMSYNIIAYELIHNRVQQPSWLTTKDICIELHSGMCGIPHLLFLFFLVGTNREVKISDYAEERKRSPAKNRQLLSLI